MTRIDHAEDDGDVERRRILDRLRALETGNALAHASLTDEGVFRIKRGAQVVAAVGHFGALSGVFILSGGQLVTVQTYLAQQIAASRASVQEDLDWLGQQISALSAGLSGVDGRLGTAEAGLDWVGARSQIHDSQISGLSGRMNGAEADIDSLAGSRDSQRATINALIDYAAAISERFENHMDRYHGGRNPGRPTPPAKG